MPIITRLVQGKKNPNRVNLYLDNQFALALSIDKVGERDLKKGLELTEAQIDDLKDTDETDYIYAKLLNFLSYRPRTIKEVRDRLYKYDVRDATKQDVLVNKLKSQGYLDDSSFASWFIASRNTHRPRSTRLLKSELKSKGVSEEIIQAVLTQITPESETIHRLLTKKLGLGRTLAQPERQKLLAYLSRQGFAWDKIAEVVKSWESE